MELAKCVVETAISVVKIAIPFLYRTGSFTHQLAQAEADTPGAAHANLH